MDEQAPRWGMGKRIGFLFLATYFTLNIIPDAMVAVPVVGEVGSAGWLSAVGGADAGARQRGARDRGADRGRADRQRRHDLEWQMTREFEAMKVASPLTGVYEVEEFSRDGAAVGLGEPSRWRRFTIGQYPFAAILLLVTRGFHWINERPYNR